MKISNIVLHTDGNGFWSTKVAEVPVDGMGLNATKYTYNGEEQIVGELTVHFNPKNWNVEEDGLIYTDKRFKTELNELLAEMGLENATYSEQGMQGDDYVSFDVSDKFVKTWEKKGFEINWWEE